MELFTVTNILLLLLTGILSGLLAGLMGVGGGLVNVPALYYVFQMVGYPKENCFHMALGTSLAIIIFTSSSAARTHHNNQNVNIKVALIAGATGIIGSFAASLIAVNLSDSLLKKAFAILLYVAAIRLITKKPKNNVAQKEIRPETSRLAIIGVLSGLLAGFFGIGGGLVGVPLFILWIHLSPHKAIGSSSLMVVILSISAALGYALSSPAVQLPMSWGYVNLPAWILVSCSSILAAYFGAKIAASVSARTLTFIFVGGLIVVATKMLID